MADGEAHFRLGAFDEVLDAVEHVMRVFTLEGVQWRQAVGPKFLRTARVAGAGDASSARAGVILIAALVRSLAHETGREEEQILAELRRSLSG